jgi:hypothetical protein
MTDTTDKWKGIQDADLYTSTTGYSDKDLLSGLTVVPPASAWATSSYSEHCLRTGQTYSSSRGNYL